MIILFLSYFSFFFCFFHFSSSFFVFFLFCFHVPILLLFFFFTSPFSFPSSLVFIFICSSGHRNVYVLPVFSLLERSSEFSLSTSIAMNFTSPAMEGVEGAGSFLSIILYSHTERLIGLVLLPVLNLAYLLAIGLTHYILATCQGTQENMQLFFRAATLLDGLRCISFFIGKALEMTQAISGATAICWVRPVVNFMFPFPTVTTFICIHLDRLLMLTKPLRYHSLASPQRARKVIIFISVTAVLYLIIFLPIQGFPFVVCPTLPLSTINVTLHDEIIARFYTLGRRKALVFVIPVYFGIVLLTFSGICIGVLSFKQAVQIRRELRQINVGPACVHRPAPVSAVKGVVTVLIITLNFYLIWGCSFLRIQNETRFKLPWLDLLTAVLEILFGLSNIMAIILTNRNLRNHTRVVLNNIFKLAL